MRRHHRRQMHADEADGGGGGKSLHNTRPRAGRRTNGIIAKDTEKCANTQGKKGKGMEILATKDSPVVFIMGFMGRAGKGHVLEYYAFSFSFEAAVYLASDQSRTESRPKPRPQRRCCMICSGCRGRRGSSRARRGRDSSTRQRRSWRCTDGGVGQVLVEAGPGRRPSGWLAG